MRMTRDDTYILLYSLDDTSDGIKVPTYVNKAVFRGGGGINSLIGFYHLQLL